MRVLDRSEIRPGTTVWLEDNGLAFKDLYLQRSLCIAVGKKRALFLPFRDLELELYDCDAMWRCWDEKPDCDSLAEMEWKENAAWETAAVC